MHVMAARKALDRALELDPGSVEANLYRVYMLLSRGEKESARHGIEHLLRTAANDWNVHLVAGITLRVDGMYEEALDQFHRFPHAQPFQRRRHLQPPRPRLPVPEPARAGGRRAAKGSHPRAQYPLLRTSLAYQRMRQGDLHQAIEMLEDVIRDDSSMRIAVPTLAMCYVQMGNRDRAASLIGEESIAAAEADSEMAYRLATYFAVDGDESEALHWLRRAIYLGNENYPWFLKNPAWNRLREHADFERILEDLKKATAATKKPGSGCSPNPRRDGWPIQAFFWLEWDTATP